VYRTDVRDQPFGEQLPDVKPVKASVVIAAGAGYSAEAIAAARELGVEVLRTPGTASSSVTHDDRDRFRASEAATAWRARS
jgi:hypothetical protein